MTLRAAVLGHPIGHSKSPALHRAAYAQLGADLAYEAIDVTVDALPVFMAGVRGDGRWRGLSVTMPLKAAMAAEVDDIRGVARQLGVINTVAFESGPHDGSPARLVGYNTDVAGIVNALRYAGATAKPVAVVLGGGGTAAAAIAAMKEFGAASVAVYVRDVARAAEARAAAAAVGLSLQVLPLTGAAPAVAAADVVISTLPPRAADGVAEELARHGSLVDGVLLDVAYDPWPSRIATVFSDAGGRVVPGLEMLLYQAVEQVRYFTGLEGPAAAEVIDVMCDAVGAPRRAF
ncbi:shikimate dehydrogenase [Arthrobacter sp. UYEF3]|uniref:shikimate dehydrogenase n=1 Tax=Arthrobacter sp. UYEF3 TaxID=1756365 RepID=UPI003396F947